MLVGNTLHRGGGVAEALVIVSGTFNVAAVTSAHDLHFEIWNDSGGSPVAQIGVDSNTVNVSATGEQTITFGTQVDITGQTVVWIVPVVSGGDVNYNRHTSLSGVDSSTLGGSFIYNLTVTNLSQGTSFVPRMSVLLSNGTRLGNKDVGTTAVGLGGGGQAGLRITTA